jgi:hypothetical protein
MRQTDILELADKTRFDCAYMGVGGTGANIFLIYNSDIMSVAMAFGDASKTKVMVLNPDKEYRQEFYYYTRLASLNQEADYIRVAMKEDI